MHNIHNEIVDLLKNLIRTASVSGEEALAARIVRSFLSACSVQSARLFNNIWAYNKNHDPAKPTLLLNSHLDTVMPNPGWTRDPFSGQTQNGKLFGLGSNDAGASLVALLAAFLHFYRAKDLNHNLIFLASAEEETSGKKGIKSVLPELGQIDLAIVGEPTGMRLAVAEKGLIVLHCQAKGKPGHAARDTGVNAISLAMKDIDWFHSFRFAEESEILGPVKMSVTMINAGAQHNVVPSECDFTVDIRTTDAYTNDQVLQTVRQHISSSIAEPSLNLNPSSIPAEHRLLKTARELNIPRFGSPTLSDQALISAPSVKIGPGLSERSHTADEFIYLAEIEQGIQGYIALLESFLRA